MLYSGSDTADHTVSLYVERAAVAEICTHIIKEQFGREVVPDKTGTRDIMLLQFESKSAAEFLRATSIDMDKLFKCEECMPSFLRGVFV